MTEPLGQRDSRSSGLHETIRGGEHVLIRRIRPEDMALYPDFLNDVSADDLRLRFFATARISEFSAAEVRKLSHLDYSREMAFIALDQDTGQMLGLARLKDELDEQTAEFAILVRSRLKGHGLGWLLMQRAIDYAKEKSLRRVYGDVLVENAAMLQMCAELGFHAHDIGSGVRRVVLDLGTEASQRANSQRDAARSRRSIGWIPPCPRPDHAREVRRHAQAWRCCAGLNTCRF